MINQENGRGILHLEAVVDDIIFKIWAFAHPQSMDCEHGLPQPEIWTHRKVAAIPIASCIRLRFFSITYEEILGTLNRDQPEPGKVGQRPPVFP